MLSTRVRPPQRGTALADVSGNRFLVARQAGELHVIKNGVLLPTPALWLAVDASGERGLLGIAVDPAFASNGYVCLHYTVPASGGNPPFGRVARFTKVGDALAPPSGTTLLDLDPLGPSDNHNGGALRFGPDGQLYAGVGEHEVAANAQSLASTLGKVLRIDPATGAPSSGNPFLGVPGGAGEIWALGLRNPFKMDFSPDDGSLFIDDVGTGPFEEIDLGVAGGNFGWPAEEGPGPDPSLLDPIYWYGHGQGCAITGGAFYGASQTTFGPAYAGDYFFADLCSGAIYLRDALSGGVAPFASGFGFGLVDLLVGSDGALYALRNGGELVRIAPDRDGDGHDDTVDNRRLPDRARRNPREARRAEPRPVRVGSRRAARAGKVRRERRRQPRPDLSLQRRRRHAHPARQPRPRARSAASPPRRGRELSAKRGPVSSLDAPRVPRLGSPLVLDAPARGARGGSETTGMFNPNNAYGNVVDAIEYVEGLIAAGADEVIFPLQMRTVPQAAILESIENLGRHVIPRFKK